MMLLPNRTLHINFPSIRGRTNSIMDNSDSLLPLGVWTQIEIAQVQDGDSTKIVFFRDQALVGQIENTQPENIFGVNVYAAGARTLQTFQPGAIQEMKIRTNMSGPLRNIYSHPDTYKPVRGNLMTTIAKLGKEWRISFYFEPFEYGSAPEGDTESNATNL